MIYLDNAATTYPKPDCVYEALDYANRNLAFNAGRGSYKQAKEVADMIWDTRKMVASLVNASPEMVCFESSATEALNIIINGLELNKGDTVYISPFEHNAVVRPLYNLKKTKGIEIKILPFDKETWDIDIKKMNDMFAINKPKACFLSQVSNVTGYILPVSVIFETTAKFNCVNTLDSSQSLGILNPDIKNVDFIVFAGHKSLYASFGVGGFINLNNRKLSIVKSGGTGSDSLNHYMPEEKYLRFEAGSNNSVAIYGLNRSINWLKSQNIYEKEKSLTLKLIENINSLKKVELYIPKDFSRIFGVISFNVNQYDSNDLGVILAEDYNICVRTGYHCSPFVHEFIGSTDNRGTVRVGLGAFSREEDIIQLCEALKELI